MAKAVSVHVHEVSDSGEPSKEFIERANKGISLLKDILEKDEKGILIANCGPAVKIGGGFKKIGERPYHAEIMRDEAIKQGIPKKLIYSQFFSLDSVGEVFFPLPLIIIPLGIKELEVISSEHHKPRLEVIYNKIYPKEYKINFNFISAKKYINEEKVKEHEKNSIKLFNDQFGSVPDGNLTLIEQILYTKHRLYNRTSENQKLRFFS